MESLIRTTTAIEECRKHLEDTDSFGTPVENYLTNHIVVLLCSEVEETVRSLIHEHIAEMSAKHVRDFVVGRMARNVVRNASHSEIKDVIGSFGKHFKTSYDDSVRAMIGEAGISQIGNAVSHRDDIAHRTPPKLTFTEVSQAHEAAEKVVEAVKSVLGDHAALTGA